MPTQDSGRPAHREWIARARSQAEAADQHAGGARGAGSFSADALPGYELEREIHRGAQGVVYRAVQMSTGRRVAIKLLHDAALGEPLERARFEREMRVLATLRHPNIVSIHDGGSQSGRFFLVMEYIAGQPLDTFMASSPRSVRQTLEIFAQICEAVNEAHVRGIIHRDIKPANVRVDESGRPFVLDFGLAKITSEVRDSAPGAGSQREAQTPGISDLTPPEPPARTRTMTGQFLGSLPWAAPEQVEARPTPIDIRTDVYALGVLVYQMLTGKFPYPVAGPMKATIDAILNAAPTQPRGIRREIDDEVETIVLKCLRKERERRYQNAGEIARDVRRYLAGELIEAKRDSAWYALRKTVRRYRIPLSVVGLFMLLLTGSTIVAWTLSARAHDAAVAAGRAESAARESEARAQLRLRDSLVVQARLTRRGGQVGQRFDALNVLTAAAQIAPNLDARNEAIAALALPDLQPVKRLAPAGAGYVDREFARCAITGSAGEVVVVRIEDGIELGRLPPPTAGLKQIIGAQLVGPYFIRVFDPLAGDRRLEVWNVTTGRLHFERPGIAPRSRFDVAPDGRRLAIAQLDQAIHVYELESAGEIQRVPLERRAAYVTFDPTGDRLVLYHADYADAVIIDLSSGQAAPAFTNTRIDWDTAWHPSAPLIAGAAGFQIALWDPVARESRGTLSDHQAQVVHLRFSRDGELLLSQSMDGVACLWDMRSRRPLLRFRMMRPVLSPDGRFITGSTPAGEAEQVEVLAVEFGTQRRQLFSPTDADRTLFAHGTFDPAGRHLVAAVDGIGFRVFDLQSGALTGEISQPCLGPATIDPRGDFLVSGDLHGVLRWPLVHTPGRLEFAPPQNILNVPAPARVQLGARGAVALVSGYGQSEFALLDLRGDAEPRRFPASGGVAHISADGRWAVTDPLDNAGGEIFDLSAGRRVATLPPVKRGWFAFHPNGRWLLQSGPDRTLVREVGSWRTLREGPPIGGALTFSPAGTLGAIPSGASVRLLDGTSLAELAQLEPPENYYTTECVFSPDGRRLAQFTTRAGVIHLWDIEQIRIQLARLGLNWDSPQTAPY